MRYPIDVAATLSGMEPGKSRDLEEVSYQLANDCYQAALSGTPFMLHDLDEELVTFRDVIGKEPNRNHIRLLRAVIALCQDAYRQGQQDRGTPLPSE